MNSVKTELFHDNFQNYKKYGIPKAQLVIADIPYNIAGNAYASNPMWYKGGDNKNGESKLAKKAFFNSDGNFKIAEYMHFCSRLLKKEPKEKNQAPAMIVFCAFEQIQTVIDYGKRYGFQKFYPLPPFRQHPYTGYPYRRFSGRAQCHPVSGHIRRSLVQTGMAS